MELNFRKRGGKVKKATSGKISDKEYRAIIAKKRAEYEAKVSPEFREAVKAIAKKYEPVLKRLAEK